MTLAEKYKDKASKSLKSQLLEAVEAKLQKAKPGEQFIYRIGWYECGCENYLKIHEPNDICGFDALTHEGSHNEINAIMKSEGFKAIEDYGGSRYRANTTYVLESNK